LEIIGVDFGIINQLLTAHSPLATYHTHKKKQECNGKVHQLFIHFKKACDCQKINTVHKSHWIW